MQPWTYVALRIFVLVGIVLSWGATIVPLFPAPAVMWGLSLLYGIVTGLASGFTTRTIVFMVVITVLAVVSMVTDNIFSILGARKGGARWSSVLVSSVVGFVTSIFFTPIIGILATFGSMYLIESAYQADAAKAWQTTKRMLIGWGWSTVARLAIGLIILILYVLWAWF